MDARQLILDNPITASVIAAIGLFIKPIAKALQAALIRRIDRLWPDVGPHEERVRKTVDALSLSRVPGVRPIVEAAVRKHKSNPPPNAAGGTEG
ncbi:MAG: hypothetical protein QGG14_00815 [Planctomycetota bacterium]|jgi:hypothetical protein|nr:hypothetical protein [Planctomycetota bacterium]